MSYRDRDRGRDRRSRSRDRGGDRREKRVSLLVRNLAFDTRWVEREKKKESVGGTELVVGIVRWLRLIEELSVTRPGSSPCFPFLHPSLIPSCLSHRVEDIRRLFDKYGDVKDVYIPMNFHTK